MNKQREALRIALDALEDYQTNGAPFFRCDSAVAAIREALAEPEQKSACFKCGHAWHPDECVNTAPAARKPLTDAEMRQCANAMDAEPLSEGWKELIKFARAIERAHGIGEA